MINVPLILMKIKAKTKTLSPLLPLAAVAFTALVGTLAILKAEQIEKDVKNWANQYIPYKTQENVLKTQMQTAVSLLDGLNAKYEKGQISLISAQKSGAEILSSLRYGDNNKGYFWVVTVDGVSVVKNPVPPFSKNSYTLQYKPWNWTIGTVYHPDN